MRFVTAKKGERVFVGIMDEEGKMVLNLQSAAELLGKHASYLSDFLRCLDRGDSFLKEVEEILLLVKNTTVGNVYEDITKVEILAPIPRPRKNIFCVGKNYAAHAIEMGSEADIPKAPMLFSKAPTSVTGPDSVILNHSHVTSELDYEGELAVVIGKTGNRISEENAMEYVFGYTIINDITARDLQTKHKQFLLGKSMDTSCPMGPTIVHKSLVQDPHQLKIETKVNGEVRQSATTEQFIFNIPNLISTISQATTLEAGDIIATGTPAGVGKGFQPPKYLNPNDVIEIEIEQLGILRNYIEA
ncbi:fumarylacetoacetate hydrolase family protein [Bacillus solimangrovi]|uniref:Fumarylacetoacetase-like C-terminal domain-containing protein n=1 Tax=Bacillus solimangrovi TaxID=1305675 RepID=A0A1E5LC57_9BACI|nr:fumarylacetoacetate hydrolase family protein [Bacillus solimangrovi]OEH91666.1 hypothetical protein BFG57_04660 [Bacillus solimangrovi]